MQAPNLGWRNEPFHELLASRFPPGLPIRLANDADVGAMAEHLRGAARGASDAIFLIGKIGVGAGMIVGGRALSGAGGLAGEVGHMVLDPTGPVCRCGSNGCMEALVGEAALLEPAAGAAAEPARGGPGAEGGAARRAGRSGRRREGRLCAGPRHSQPGQPAEPRGRDLGRIARPDPGARPLQHRGGAGPPGDGRAATDGDLAHAGPRR